MLKVMKAFTSLTLSSLELNVNIIWTDIVVQCTPSIHHFLKEVYFDRVDELRRREQNSWGEIHSTKSHFHFNYTCSEIMWLRLRSLLIHPKER